MTHVEIYEIYKQQLEHYEKQTVMWFPNGHHSIRVRLEDGEEFVFSYFNKRHWRFETLTRFMKKMKGAKQM